LLIPLVINLEEDRLLGPDKRDGDFEVEISFKSGLGDVVGWAEGAVDGAKTGKCAFGDPTVWC
jgi:hypothetical protein